MKLKQEEEKKKKKGNIGRQIYRVILYAFLYSFGAVASFAAVVLFFGTIGYIRTKTLYDEANAEYVNVVSRNQTKAAASVSGDGAKDAGAVQNGSASLSKNSVSSDASASGNGAGGGGQSVDTRSVDEIQVDIKALQQVNPDVVGWIYFEDGLISYPILFSGDNEKYLKRNYKGNYMASGSIFLEATSARDFSDLYTQIYGHNMRDLTMFGKLRYYKSRPDYYKNHGYFHIITADHDYRYQIFCCKQVITDSEVYTVIHKNTPGLAAFANMYLVPGSVINVPVDIKEGDHILALSTCVNDYAYRMIVCGVRVNDTPVVIPAPTEPAAGDPASQGVPADQGTADQGPVVVDMPMPVGNV